MSPLEPEPRTLVPAGAGRRALERLPRPHVAAFAVEVAVVAAGALIYFLVRGAVVDRAAEAVARAQGLMEIERALGLFWEPALHERALSSRFLTELMNGIYFWLHMPLIVVVAVTLFWRRRPLYVFTRNAFLVSALAALAVYYVLPLAPPALLPRARVRGHSRPLRRWLPGGGGRSLRQLRTRRCPACISAGPC